jgi:hypothetical protein
MTLDPVPSPDVEEHWHFAAPWVESAVREGALVETADTYKGRCLDRTAQLWLIRDQDQTVGACISEIYDTPKGLTCAVPICAAVSLDDALVPLFDTFERWARAEGCVRLEGYGRPGWTKAMRPHGWRPVSVVIEKDI